jgi:hypothetical protein
MALVSASVEGHAGVVVSTLPKMNVGLAAVA